MRTSITRALALLAALSALPGVVPSARAQGITVSPAAVTLSVSGSPSFNATYSTSGSVPAACSDLGQFTTGPDLATSLLLGEINRPMSLPSLSTAQESVVVPSGVIDQVRSLRITTPVYYRRDWKGCVGALAMPVITTRVAVTFVSASVEATPVAARVATGTDTLVSVRWKVLFGDGVSARVESREGRFMDGRGSAYGAAVVEPLQTAGQGQAEVGETLRVPGSVVREILRAGGTSGMRFERTFLVNGIPAAGTLLLQPANAIQAVVSKPAQVGVSPQSTGRASVRWEATLLPGVAAPTGSSLSLTSSEGVFRSQDGRVLGRVSTTISQPVPAAAPTALSARAAGAVVAVNEQLTIPRAVIDAALEAGFAWFSFQRIFRVGEDSAPGELRLDFVGRVGASFGIDRAELRFPDGTRFKTVSPGEEVRAEADITFRGSGELRGSWDLAGPTSTSGAPIFTRTQLVSERLSFGRRTLLRSPAVMAAQPGLYIVRLTITEPGPYEQQSLQVSFVVRAAGEAAEFALRQPAAQARVTPGSLFEWESVAGARNYLLEFYDLSTAEGREPAAGVVLPGTATRAALSQAAGRNLQPGRSYWWRVVALGPDGVLLGRSALRELITTQQ